jgi:DNA polymerase elongation subunit (family B)
MGFSQFRLYKPEVADAITYFARQALKFAVLKFNEYGHKTLYGDTDSIFVKSMGKNAEQMEKQLELYNESLKEDLVKKYNTGLQDEYMMMDLKFEYDMEKIYFGDSKKRYYGIVRDTGKKYIRGMNIIRKDTPEFMKGALNKIAEFAVREKLSVDHLIALRKKLESVNYKEIGISKSFTKKFNEYIKTMPQHVKASVWANEKLNTTIKNTDNPYLFYIKSNCEEDMKSRDRQTAICLNEEDLHLVDDRKDVFELDYDTFFKKQVLDQLKEFNKIDSVKNILEEYKETN